MNSAAAIDVAVFRWINRDLARPWLDPWMRWLSDNPVFVPAAVVLAVAVAWKGGRRGWIFLVLLGMAVGLANELLVEPLKDWVQRPRPFVTVGDAILRVGRGNPLGSMPSGHATLTAVAATVTGWFYPRVLWGVVPVVAAIGLSRVYNGSHYPSDVLAGFALGAGFVGVFLWLVERGWRSWAQRWCPRWACRMPSLLHPARTTLAAAGDPGKAEA